MKLLIIGEAATKLMVEYQGFLDLHWEVLWASMKGRRNRIAHGSFDII